MSRLRPECGPGDMGSYVGYWDALKMVERSVSKRRGLIHGSLNKGKSHCAMGCFWADNGPVSVSTDLVDEVAAVNDSVPAGTPARERWRIVRNWLREKLKNAA